MTLSEGEEREERGRLQGLGPSQDFDITSFACVGLSLTPSSHGKPGTMLQLKRIRKSLEDSRLPWAGILES